jgi:hypothetical protein
MAPPRESLNIFGGTMTIEEYRKGFLMIKDYDWIETHFHRVNDMDQVMKAAQTLSPMRRRAWGFCHVMYPPPPGSLVEYVRILPLSNRTFREETSNNFFTESSGSKPKRVPRRRVLATEEQPQEPLPTIVKEPRILQGTTQPRPQARAKVQVAHGVSRIDSNKPPSPPSNTIMTNEQLLSVNEEQAYYTRNLRQFGNLVDAMGISITRGQGS